MIKSRLDTQWIEMRDINSGVLLLILHISYMVVVMHLASPYKVEAVPKMPSYKPDQL